MRSRIMQYIGIDSNVFCFGEPHIFFYIDESKHKIFRLDLNKEEGDPEQVSISRDTLMPYNFYMK